MQKTYRRYFNLLTNKFRRGGIQVSKPIYLQVESTTKCNGRCVECVRRFARIRIGDMKMKTFRNIEPILPYVWRVNLSVCGEPLLAKNLFKMIKICKKYNCRVSFITNGLLLTKSVAKKLIKHNVDFIAVSLDGISERTYGKIRRYPVSTVLRNLENLTKMKEKLGARKPRVKISFVGMRINVQELPSLIEFVKRYDVKEISVLQLLVYHNKLRDQLLLYHKKIARKYFELARRKAEELNIALLLPSLNENEACEICEEPFNTMYILYNGDVFPCNTEACPPQCYKSEFFIGNVNETSIFKLWNSEGFVKLRKGLLGKSSLPECCRNCPVLNNRKKAYIRIIK
jgi:radical SAM protein with 4Fe4S-binding SPASM domain